MIRAFLLVLAMVRLDATAVEPVQPGVGTVRVAVPPLVLIQVTDVGADRATAVPVTVSFNQALLSTGQALRISVKADSSLVLPDGQTIPASNLRWTASQVINGVGMSGVLSASTYTPVYESRVEARTGRVDLTWELVIPPAITRAGTAQLSLRWKFEAVTP